MPTFPPNPGPDARGPVWPTAAERAAALAPLNRYCELVDEGRIPIDAFATDCEADYGTRHGLIRGKEALTAFFARNHAVLRHTSHHLSTVRVRIDPERPGELRVGAHVTAWHELTDGRRFEAFGRYDDVVVQEAGEFLIRERRFRAYGASDPSFRFARIDRNPRGHATPETSAS